MVHHIIYIYINAAASCKRYPPSLPYIIIVQTCGKRWDLPKFVDVFSVNLGFSQSLIYICIYIYYSALPISDWWFQHVFFPQEHVVRLGVDMLDVLPVGAASQ